MPNSLKSAPGNSSSWRTISVMRPVARSRKRMSVIGAINPFHKMSFAAISGPPRVRGIPDSRYLGLLCRFLEFSFCSSTVHARQPPQPPYRPPPSCVRCIRANKRFVYKFEINTFALWTPVPLRHPPSRHPTNRPQCVSKTMGPSLCVMRDSCLRSSSDSVSSGT